ncbi:MAG: aldo/keto reductase [Candidatus Aminicenantes bacterium]|nr:aldo/keto reductase [Candidatus Aminicenantes bacterium]
MRKQDEQTDRRGFLKTCFAGLAAFGLLGKGRLRPSSGFESQDSRDLNGKDVVRRTLGKTGLRLPVVSMGVMNTSSPDLVRKSFETGVRLFDTAAFYQRGQNETMVGQVIKDLRAREDVAVATKALSPVERRPLPPKERKTAFLASAEESLRRLQTDYIDILYFHSVDNLEELTNPWVQEAMQEVKDRKKARAVGFSTHRSLPCIREAAKSGFFDVILTTYNYSLHDDRELSQALTAAHSEGIGIIAMKTQCGNYLDRQGWPEHLKKYIKGKILHTAVLKWALRNEFITTAIPGFSNFQHIEEDFSVAYDLEYTPEEKRFLEEKGLILALGYCQQCGRCLRTCPRSVEVPTLMRAHLYAACYTNFSQARDALQSLPQERGLPACETCPRCQAACPNGIDVAKRIEELKTLWA